MFRFKKVGSFLSVLTVFSVVAATFPIQAFAEVYTGELQLPNTRVLPDYGGGYISMASFNNSYFASEPTFSARESNNFITSLPQKVFSASLQDGVLNCGSNDVNLNPANNSIVLTGTRYAGDENNTPYTSHCQPSVWPTVQNTVLANTGSGNSYSGLGVTQTYDALPAFTLGESTQNTVVESIPNDPNNVRVTVSENVIQESYGLNFERQGDVWTVYNGRDMSLWYEDNNLYKNGTNYIINWLSNWVGQVPISLSDENGTIFWGDPSTVSWDDNGRIVSDPLYVNTGYPTPQIVQLASIAPTLVSSSVVRPRNSDILSETQPQYTRWSTCSFFRGCTQHMYAIKYELSADGRTGRGIIYQSWDTGGGFRDLVGVGLLVAAVVISAQFGVDFTDLFSQFRGLLSPNLPFQAISDAVVASSNPLQTLFPALTPEAIQGSIASILTSSIGASVLSFTAGAVAAIAGATALGTVEQQIASSGVEGQEGVWIWTWSQAPGYTPGGNPVCANGATDYPVCTPPPSTCPNGATNYPICTITIIDRLFCPDGTPRPADGICGTTGVFCPDGSVKPASGICPGGGPDLCLNLAGIQATVPSGYTRDASGNCTRGGSGDLCTNLAGTQMSVPAGYTRNANGECTPTTTERPRSISCEDQAPGGAVQCFSVRPTLLRSGERTTLVWNVSDASCSVTGTNNDRWPNQNASRSGGEKSSAITGQTTFTLNCAALPGASGPPEISESQTVNVIPAFQEQ